MISFSLPYLVLLSAFFFATSGAAEANTRSLNVIKCESGDKLDRVAITYYAQSPREGASLYAAAFNFASWKSCGNDLRACLFAAAGNIEPIYNGASNRYERLDAKVTKINDEGFSDFFSVVEASLSTQPFDQWVTKDSRTTFTAKLVVEYHPYRKTPSRQEKQLTSEKELACELIVF